MTHERGFVWLDLARGLSAIAVCSTHLRALILMDLPEVDAPNVFHRLFYFLSGLGDSAVIVFIVLSGFLIGGSILTSAENFSLSRYAVARLTRLWTVLLPALLLTLCVDNALSYFAPDVLLGSNYEAWGMGPLPDDSYSISGATFLGNVFFAQTIYTPVFGTNQPLWTLAYEFWYYTLFCFMALASGHCGNSKDVKARIAATVACVVILANLPDAIQFLYLIWLMGVVAFLIYRYRPIRHCHVLLLSVSAAGFVASLVYSKIPAWQAILNVRADVVVGLATAALCVAAVCQPLPKPSKLNEAIGRFARATSEFSFSLYLTHYPLLILIVGVGYGTTTLAPNAAGLSHFVGWLAALLLAAVLFWFLFERHTKAIRVAINGYLKLR